MTIESASPESKDPLREIFGEPIHVYTRAQALADGVLADVTPLAAGLLKIPVAFTSALWALVESVPAPLVETETLEKRTRGILREIIVSARRSEKKTDRISLASFLVTADGARSLDLLAVCGPGDRGEPVLTVGFPCDF